MPPELDPRPKQISPFIKSLVTDVSEPELELTHNEIAVPAIPKCIHDSLVLNGHVVERVVGEFWTARQRQASSIHEVSYRACFKPQLPAFFIKRFTAPGDIVYDPFSGRGTTAIEAALLGRKVIANDVNPLSQILARPRLSIPALSDVESRLNIIPISEGIRANIDLTMFYHPDTEAEIVSLKNYLSDRNTEGAEDELDAWIRMIATNRLTGHSSGFFSVYSFPPNQAVTAESQKKINLKRNQTPEYRNTKKIILKKSKQLIGDLTERDIMYLTRASDTAQFLTGSASQTPQIEKNTVKLTVTSPPFLDIVNYAEDNWLRCWFNSLNLDEIAAGITRAKNLEAWIGTMSAVLNELFRITAPRGVVAFEVGEVRNGKIKLDEHIVPLGVAAGFVCEAIMINSQIFTKTSNLWGVSNNEAGTNSNRIVIFRKIP